MLQYNAAQVIACGSKDMKPWNINGKTGETHTAKLAVVSASGEATSIRLKAKTEKELTEKIAKYTVGKPAVIPITEVVPVFRAGDRKAADYEYTS
jgi:hypothetical protein